MKTIEQNKKLLRVKTVLFGNCHLEAGQHVCGITVLESDMRK